MSDATATLKAIAEDQVPGAHLGLPMLADMRTVRMATLPSGDIAAFFFERRQQGIPATANPLACLCDDLGTFGMLRMFGVYAELSGVRPEQDFCVTADLEEAVVWLAERGKIAPADAGAVAHQVDLAREALAGTVSTVPVKT